MVSRTLFVFCLLGLAMMARASRPKSCPGPGSTACAANWEGKMNRKTKEVSCVPCRKGYYTPVTGSCCRECEGIMIDGACNRCPRDSDLKRTIDGTLTCMCESGTQATGADPVLGVSGCTRCPAGTYNPAKTQATDACQPCPANTVSGGDAERCYPCPLNTVANEDQSACVCASNFYAAYIPTRRSPSPYHDDSYKSSPRPVRVSSRDGIDHDDDNDDDFNGHDDDHGDYKRAPVCTRCADPTENEQPNLWPTCCAAGTSWDGTACV